MSICYYIPVKDELEYLEKSIPNLFTNVGEDDMILISIDKDKTPISVRNYLSTFEDEPDTYGDIKNSFHQNENIELKITPIQRPKLSKIKYVATDYTTKVKQMEMIDSFFEQLNSSNEGVSKTTFLKSIGKDNRGGEKRL